MTVIVRSALFNLAFYLNLIIRMIVSVYVFALPRHLGWRVVVAWSTSSSWLLRVIGGVDARIDGRDRIPKGPLIVAAKHQSVWETFALIPLFRSPTFILKRELMWIPVFGWYALKFRMIPIDRGKRGQALKKMLAIARKELADDRQILIFPEGTRKTPGAAPDYRYGVARLYAELGVPCLPVALNSGLYWPRRTFRRYPGTIRAEILEPIPPGLEQEEFLYLLEKRIEAACMPLYSAAAKAADPPPIPAALANQLRSETKTVDAP